MPTFTIAQINQMLITYVENEMHPAQAILPATSLIVTGLIDSWSIFKLIFFIEEQFAIKIAPEEITLESFETIEALTALIRRKSVA